MRENKALRAAGVLFLATMFSTCVVSGTYAKYTAVAPGVNEARVAKFGVVAKISGSLYGDAYKDEIVNYDDESATVQVASQGDGAVAPGTENNGDFAFGISGKPEVDVKVYSEIKYDNIFLKRGAYGVAKKIDDINPNNFQAYKDMTTSGGFRALLQTGAGSPGPLYIVADDESIDATKEYYLITDYAVLSNDYYPVTYSLEGASSYDPSTLPDPTAVDTIALLSNQALSQMSGTQSGKVCTSEKIFKANTDLSDDTVGTGISEEKIHWKWEFNLDDSKNLADTILGILSSGSTTNGVPIILKGQITGNSAYFENLTKDSEKSNYSLSTKFDIKLKIEQVD